MARNNSGIPPEIEQYVWRRKNDGLYPIDFKKTWEKLVRAARVVNAMSDAEVLEATSSTAISSGAVATSRPATLADFGLLPDAPKPPRQEKIARRNDNFGNHPARYGNDRSTQNYR